MPGDTVRACLASIGLTEKELAGCAGLHAEWALIKVWDRRNRFPSSAPSFLTPFPFVLCLHLHQRYFFHAARDHHPDKGGDAVVFRDKRAAFEALRNLFQEGAISLFSTSGSKSTASFFDESRDYFDAGPVPSWDYFQAAETTPMPLYRIEQAKSGRSKCHQTGKFSKHGNKDLIGAGEVRIGQIDGLGSAIEGQAGTYTRFQHLDCWRVPNKVRSQHVQFRKLRGVNAV